MIAPHCDSCAGGRNYPYPYTGVFRFGSARHLGENPNGVWTLRLTDKATSTGSPMKLKSWSLKIYGHRSTPGAPAVNQTAAVDSGKITVFWSEPDNTGASAVTAYEVRHTTSAAPGNSGSDWGAPARVGGGRATTTATPGNSGSDWSAPISVGGGRTRGYTVSGLTDGTRYDVQVRAVNAQGDGVWSDTVTATPAAVASAPPYFTEGAATMRSVVENTPCRYSRRRRCRGCGHRRRCAGILAGRR